MATQLINQAIVSYLYGGQSQPSSAISNYTSTTLLDEYAICIEKTSTTDTYTPGSKITYCVRVVNCGSGSVNNVKITDNLGGGLLKYVDNSALVYINGTPATVSPIVSPYSICFELPSSLQPEGSIIIIYTVTVNCAYDTHCITNTVTAEANGVCSPYTHVCDTATQTIKLCKYADVTIVKQASADTIIPCQELTYTFTLLNKGNLDATSVVLSDDLPIGFTVTSVKSKTNGTVTIYKPCDYTITSGNTITLPTGTHSPSITVPAACETGAGVTVITITGTVAEPGTDCSPCRCCEAETAETAETER